MKVLWCDRNYDYVESFIEATKTMLPEIEFVLKDEPVDAIKEILTNNQDYKLIISGQIFKNMSGTDFFEIIFNNKIKTPFLLLTAQIDYNQFGQHELCPNFSYMDKLKSDFYEVANKIKSLITREGTEPFELHKKLKSLREALHLTPKEMANLVGTTESEVILSEDDYYKVVSSYVLLVMKRFKIDLDTLTKTTHQYFAEQVVPTLAIPNDRTARG